MAMKRPVIFGPNAENAASSRGVYPYKLGIVLPFRKKRRVYPNATLDALAPSDCMYSVRII